MDKTREIWYEPHPVSPARKAELRGKGYDIIDAVFAPDGKASGKATDEVVEMSKAELQTALTGKGIEHKPAMSKAELQAMLGAA